MHSFNFFKILASVSCLYALATYKNAKNYHEVLTDYDDVEGQSQQIHYILDKMDKKVINTLAVKYLWDLKNWRLLLNI